MRHEYGQFVGAMYLGDRPLLAANESWQPSEPNPAATLWRYMSFAKFCSLLDHRALFFSLVGDMDDRYEGFIYPPASRDDHLRQAESIGRDVLHLFARASLVNCWTQSEHESSLMWKSYAGSEGVAIRTDFRSLGRSILSSEALPIVSGGVTYVDYRQTEVPRFGPAPLFHKRLEYREEAEVRVVLPGPPVREEIAAPVQLDPDVAKWRGRYIPVDLEVLVHAVVLPPDSTPWFSKVVESVTANSPVASRIECSSIALPPDAAVDESA